VLRVRALVFKSGGAVLRVAKKIMSWR
jgi:hypothetical protein